MLKPVVLEGRVFHEDSVLVNGINDIRKEV
jgi:hypothetical protein